MQRKKEISVLNVVLCLLVILIHLLSAAIENNSPDSLTYKIAFVPWRLSAFAVQGFIVLSGIKLYLKPNEYGYIKYCISRAKTVFFPYLVCVTVFYVYFWLNNYVTRLDVTEYLRYIFLGNITAHLYFVVLIMQFYLLKPLWDFLVKRVNGFWAILVSFVLLIAFPKLFPNFLYGDRFFVNYIFYWIVGIYIGKNYNKFIACIKEKNYLYLAYLCVAIVEIFVAYNTISGKHIFSFVEEVHTIYVISAIFVSYKLAITAPNKTVEMSIFKRMDKASYYIYLYHPLMIYISNDILLKSVDKSKRFIPIFIITYSVSIALAYIYSKSNEKFRKK